MSRPHGRARVNASAPRAFGECDRCSFTYNLNALHWQMQWNGTALVNTRLLVCETCSDTPAEQLRSIVLPPDPRPVFNPRPPRFDVDDNRITDADDDRITDTNEDRIV